MPTSTVEDYIKQIYLQQQQVGDQLVSLGKLASAMQVVPGTATTMVKALSEAGLVRYEPRQGVQLTVAGQKLALLMLRRHRLLELFLVKALDFDWSDVHDEAEDLEHAISDRLLEKIDQYLGRPEFDPHGDPIPTAAGELADRQLMALKSLAPGQQATIGRIADQDASFLRYATDRGLKPGATITLLAIDEVGDCLTLNLNGQSLTLGSSASDKIFVSPPAAALP